MKIHQTAILSIAFVMLAAPAANAAVTVLSSGTARVCYLAAENGLEPNDYIQVCNQALSGMLNVRDRAATLVNRGILKMARFDGTGANSDFNRGLALKNDMAEGYVDRGASLIMLHRYQEALDDLNKGIAMGAQKPHVAYYDRGMANEALGNNDAAFDDYTQSAALDPKFEAPVDALKRFKRIVKPAGT